MSTQPLAENKITLTSPQQIAASIPFEFGFLPTASVVGVFYDDVGTVIVTARIDSPPELPDEELAGRFMACVERALSHDAWGVALVGYPQLDTPVRRTTQQLAAVAEVANRAGLIAKDPGYVMAGHWYSYLDESPSIDEENSQGGALLAACQWVCAGASYLPDRADVAALIAGEPTDLTREVARELERKLRTGNSPIRTAKARRLIENSIFDFVTEQPRRVRQRRTPLVDEIGAEWLADVAIAMRDRRVREPFLWRMVKHGQLANGSVEFRDAVGAMCTLTRNCPHEAVAPLASATAAVAWQCGDGATARIAAEHAQACERANVLSELVLKAVTSGVSPQRWIELMASMSVRELRATRRT